LKKISKIHIKNFQNHEDTVIELTGGLNTITGTSDSGKTAIYRTLEYIYLMGAEGYGSWDSTWVQHGASYATIFITFDDGTRLLRIKGDSKNEIYLFKDDEDEPYYSKTKVGIKYDQEVLDFLNNPFYDKEIGSLPFTNQTDSIFLVGASESKIPEFIAKMSNFTEFEQAVNYLEKENNFFSKQIRISDEKIQKYKKDLEKYADLDLKIKSIEDIEEYKIANSTIKERITLVQSIIDEANNKVSTKKQLKIENEKDVEFISVIKKHILDNEDLNAKINTMQELDEAINEHLANIDKLKIINKKFEFLVSEATDKKMKSLESKVSLIKNCHDLDDSIVKKQSELTELENLQSDAKTALKNIEDEIESIENNISEYENILAKNNLCLLCGK
jgi:chromosome segregation ATPase